MITVVYDVHIDVPTHREGEPMTEEKTEGQKSIEELVAMYVTVRDAKRDMEAKHKEELADTKKALIKLEGLIQVQLQGMDATSVKTKSGTAYLSTTSKYKTEDYQTLFDYVKESGSWHLVNITPAKESMDDLVESDEPLPPGVTVVRTISTRVRR